MERSDEARLTLSVAEAAERLGISTNSAYAAIAQGDLPHLRIGRRIVIPVTALNQWLASALHD